MHLLFALTLVYLYFPAKPAGGWGWRAYDLVLLAASWGFCLHIILNLPYINDRIIYIV